MKEENLVKGVVGGVIGSLAGVVAILIFNSLGYVASIAGFVMAICTLKLYEKFAGGISKKGIIACAIIMVVMTFLGNHLACAISVVKEVKEYGIELSTTKVFFNMFSLMSEGAIKTPTYVSNLVMVYLFTILGAFGTIKTQMNQLKNQGAPANNVVNNQAPINNMNTVQPNVMSEQPVQPQPIQPQPMPEQPIQPQSVQPQPMPNNNPIQNPTPVNNPYDPNQVNNNNNNML